MSHSPQENNLDYTAPDGTFQETNLDYLQSISEGVKGFESTSNKSTTLLTASSTYTGTAEQNSSPDMMVVVKTDQNGTLYVDFSPDGTNWDSTLSFKYDTTKINPPHVLVKGSRYVRVRFTNTGSSDQTYFRLNTYFGQFQKLTSPINATLAQNYDAISVRPTDFFLEVAEGKRQGVTPFSQFGYNDDLMASTEEVIAQFGGTFTPLTSAETLTIVSSSTSDTSAGVGARTILITGVDENKVSQSEIITMNGTTNVVSVNTWLGVNRVQVLTAGSSQYNVGNISITATISATNQANIPAQESISQQLIFHVPSTTDTYITRVVLEGAKTSGGSAPKITIKAYQLLNGVRYNLFETIMDVSIKAELIAKLENPVKISGGSIWWWTANSNTNNTFLRGRVEQVLIDK